MKRLYMFDLDATLIEGFIETEPCDACGASGFGWQDRGSGVNRPGRYREPCRACKGKGQIFGEVLPYGRVVVMPRRRERMDALVAEGASIAILTNQGGVSLGYQTLREVQEKLSLSLHRLGLSLDSTDARVTVSAATYHPDGKHPIGSPSMRKPEPGMLLAMLEHYAVRPEEAIYVGDLATDLVAADRAGVDFAWAEDFF